jgi:chorismate-pyruvate lyase
MAEILNLDSVLSLVSDFPPVGRILLATPGTLQGTLAAFFCTPVDVQVRSQKVAEENIVRDVDLVRSDTSEVVCHASTTATITRDDVKDLVLSCTAGIGQILRMLNIDATFDLLEADRDDSELRRLYRLDAPGVRFDITERFPRSAFGAHFQ